MTRYDCHTHHPPADGTVVAIRNVRLGIDALPATGLFSVGVHPWDAASTDIAVLDQAIGHDGIVAMGETGLDRACGVSWSAQEQMFIEHIRRSEEHRLPLIIHCVRAYDDVIRMRAAHRATMPWIFHGFNKASHLSSVLKHSNVWISLGERTLYNKALQEEVKRIPLERILAETDESSEPIERIYETIAQLKELPLSTIIESISNNINALFFHD